MTRRPRLGAGRQRGHPRAGGRSTRIIDAGGRLVLPGFQDTHIHLQDSGHGYGLNANLDDARSIAELQQATAQLCRHATQAHG